MYWDITTVKPVEHLRLKVTFIDGLQGTVCFKPSFLTGVFESIKDESYFNKVYVDHGVSRDGKARVNGEARLLV